MGRVEISDQKVVFNLEGFQGLMTWTRKLEVPVEQIIDVSSERPPTRFFGTFAGDTQVGCGLFLKIPLLPFGGRLYTSGR